MPRPVSCTSTASPATEPRRRPSHTGHAAPTNSVRRAPHARRVRRALAAALSLAAALAVAGCGGGAGHRHATAPAARTDWPHWGGDQENTHFAPGTTLTAGDAARLTLAWKRAEGPGQSGWETFPVVAGATMYYTTNTDQVLAVDAATGALRWSYTPQVNFFADPRATSAAPTSRGVAVGGGRVYDLTYDDRLIALDAATGAVRWQARVADPAAGNAENSPGTYWRGEVIVGGPAGDTGGAAFLAAYDARTGRRLWRTPLVPAPGHGWNAGPGAHGGGHVWMPPTVDPQTGIVYAATGNPTPALRAAGRAGCDRWADATVALDAHTGRLLWGHSELCRDAWDYDTDQSPVVFDLHTAGHERRVVGDASKAGFYSVMDARTGALVARSPELVSYSHPHRAPDRAGAVVCPGIFGGIEYGPAAYSPATGSLYVLGTDACMRYTADSAAADARHRPGGDDLGGTAVPVGHASGVIAALDPATGHVRWRRRLPAAAVGGVLATGGGLVIAGDDDGYLYAFSAHTGRLVRRLRIGLRFGSAPLTYRVAGRTYLAIVAGGSAFAGGPAAPRGGRLAVFALGH